jgi:hypothetical protein
MANLAYTKRDLGQNNLAIELMTRSATVSSRVLGHDHSDSEIRNKQAALWSSVNIDEDENGGNGDSDQPCT